MRWRLAVTVGRWVQGRDRRIVGLVEALRAVAPRAPPGEQYQDVGHSSSNEAERVWHSERAPSAVPSATAFSDTVAAAAAARPEENGAAGSLPEGNGAAIPADDGHTPAVRKSFGWKRSRHPVATAHALFALAVIGGPIWFQEEMTAIEQVPCAHARNLAIPLVFSTMRHLVSLNLPVCLQEP